MILKAYIALLNAGLIGFAYYIDKTVSSLRQRIEELEKPKSTTRKRIVSEI
jgi:hypothetical protein